MKRRNFLKFLSVTPIGVIACREKAKEEPKQAPQPQPAPEPKPANTSLRQKLGPREGLQTACSSTWDATLGRWEW